MRSKPRARGPVLDPDGLPAAPAERLMYRCLAQGLSFKVGGGNVVTLCPPLTIPLNEFDEAFSILETALAECEG